MNGNLMVFLTTNIRTHIIVGTRKTLARRSVFFLVPMMANLRVLVATLSKLPEHPTMSFRVTAAPTIKATNFSTPRKIIKGSSQEFFCDNLG
jgi:hypothetical protein